MNKAVSNRDIYLGLFCLFSTAYNLRDFTPSLFIYFIKQYYHDENTGTFHNFLPRMAQFAPPPSRAKHLFFVVLTILKHKAVSFFVGPLN